MGSSREAERLSLHRAVCTVLVALSYIWKDCWEPFIFLSGFDRWGNEMALEMPWMDLQSDQWAQEPQGCRVSLVGVRPCTWVSGEILRDWGFWGRARSLLFRRQDAHPRTSPGDAHLESSTWEADAGGPRVWGQSGLRREWPWLRRERKENQPYGHFGY